MVTVLSSGPRSAHIDSLFTELSSSGLIEATDIKCRDSSILNDIKRPAEPHYTAAVVPKSGVPHSLGSVKGGTSSSISNIEDTVSSSMNGILKLYNLSETLIPFLTLRPELHLPLPSLNLSIIKLLLRDEAATDRSAYIRKNLITVYHPVGTAKMSYDLDEMGVIDSRLRVKIIHRCYGYGH
ncbi:hypothetical protein K435DRAFT_858508 [Dendrothele bispora CBS 962.96]|uniref:Glucose-methanol-choline oxidoreductase C-terminal domain-containing protein n=1 Tax=Dendrothele bispora (strain CBS 962.96) TaxID=1314807 RepID=A0A4S8M2X7_DENBC|nr:hypothetical protein K435DRAFT_858508 [Dendrothele bispora CBS 962.96]